MNCTNCPGMDWCRTKDRPCDRFDGTSRDTQPGELLPNTPDPAVGRNGVWYAAFSVLLCAVLSLGLAQWWRA